MKTLGDIPNAQLQQLVVQQMSLRPKLILGRSVIIPLVR